MLERMMMFWKTNWLFIYMRRHNRTAYGGTHTHIRKYRENNQFKCQPVWQYTGNTYRRRPVLCHRRLRSRDSENRWTNIRKEREKERKKKNVDLKYQVKQYISLTHYVIICSLVPGVNHLLTRGGEGAGFLSRNVRRSADRAISYYHYYHVLCTTARTAAAAVAARRAGAPKYGARDVLRNLGAHNDNNNNNITTT